MLTLYENSYYRQMHWDGYDLPSQIKQRDHRVEDKEIYHGDRQNDVYDYC